MNCTKYASSIKAIALSIGLIVFSQAAVAADLGATDPLPAASIPSAANGWSLSFTTYSWLPWLAGDAVIKGRTFDIDIAPDQVIDALDWSEFPVWMSYAEARNGRLFLFNDIVYSKLAGSADFAKSAPLGLATLAGNVEADYEQTTIELGAAYEMWGNGAAGTSGYWAFDVLGGGRYWRQEASVSADLALNVVLPGSGLELSGTRVIARSGSVDWIDPFVGARVRHVLAPGQELLARGDIGGFGTGSNFSWHALATYSHQIGITDRYVVDAYIGYKALSVDYTEGSGNNRYEYDVLQHGPVLGATVRF